MMVFRGCWAATQVAMWRSILRLLDSYRGTDCEQAPDQVVTDYPMP